MPISSGLMLLYSATFVVLGVREVIKPAKPAERPT
jgi:hypothetical protein